MKVWILQLEDGYVLSVFLTRERAEEELRVLPLGPITPTITSRFVEGTE